MTHKQSLRTALVAVLATAVLATGASSQVVRAQSDDPPTPEPTAASTAAATETPESETSVSETATPDTESVDGPDQTDVIVWTPNGGALTAGGNGLVTARVTSNEGAFNPATAQYQLIVNGVFQPAQSAMATPVGNNSTIDLTANVSGAQTGSPLVFLINLSGGAQQTSPVYTISRSTRLSLPMTNNGSGASTIPRTILATGQNACDAIQNRRGGPLGSFVNYTVANTTADSWFFFVNPNQGATIVVSLTNYNTSVQGQLQVWTEQFGCGTLSSQPIAFGTNPNPRLVVGNLPRGNIYFRVVSASSQQPPPAYNISWGYAGGSGPFEPNNNPCQAVPLQPGTTLTTFIEDQYDFYSMNVTSPGTVSVLAQGITIGGAQVQMRTQLVNSACDPVTSTNLLGPNFGVVPSGGGDVGFSNFINTPGLYYIRISLANGVAPNNTAYRITWNTSASTGDTAGPIFTTNPNQPPSCNPPVSGSGCQGDIALSVAQGGTVTYYWFGMSTISGGYDTLQMQVIAVTNLVGCGAGNAGATNPSSFANNFTSVGTTASRGSVAIQFNQAGGYNVNFRALRQGQVVFSDGKPLKVGCGLQAATFIDLDGKDAKFTSTSQSLLDQPDRPVAIFTEDSPPDVKPHP